MLKLIVIDINMIRVHVQSTEYGVRSMYMYIMCTYSYSVHVFWLQVNMKWLVDSSSSSHSPGALQGRRASRESSHSLQCPLAVAATDSRVCTLAIPQSDATKHGEQRVVNEEQHH